MSNSRVPYAQAPQAPPLRGPQGKPLIAQVVVNVEAWRFDRPMPRAILPPPHGGRAIPDVPNFSWAEYGMRCGLPRIRKLLVERGIPAGATVNSAVFDVYPDAVASIADAGWELIGHGVYQQSLHDAADEREVIEQAVSRMREATGRAPRGWLGPGLQETGQTPELLKQAGLDYVLDWVLDDRPTFLHTEHGDLVAVPYSLELNDSVIHAVEHQPSSAMHDRLVDTLAWLTAEARAEAGTKVVTLALHPHLMGVPHRVGHLARALDLLCEHEDVVVMGASQICDWFLAATDEERS